MTNVSSVIAAAVEAQTRFPPSFENNPWSYGHALVSLMLVSAISLHWLLSYAFDAYRRRVVNREVDNRVVQEPFGWLSPVTIFRCIVSGLLLTILCGAAPDVITMLAWGEASDETMWTLYAVDRFFDGILLYPFLASFLIAMTAAALMEQRLASGPSAARRAFAAAGVKEDPSAKEVIAKLKRIAIVKIRIVALVLVAAVGVTLGKAGM